MNAPRRERHERAALPQGAWSVDALHSRLGFSVKHMVFATVNGSFTEFEGTLDVSSGLPRAQGRVMAASIDTGDPVRDERLRSSADFFDVESHPEIGFRSTRIEKLADGRLRVIGLLSMRGVTHEIELAGKIGEPACGPDGIERLDLRLRGDLNRGDFGLTWNQALDTGGALLGNRVRIELEISAVSERARRGAARQ